MSSYKLLIITLLLISSTIIHAFQRDISPPVDVPTEFTCEQNCELCGPKMREIAEIVDCDYETRCAIGEAVLQKCENICEIIRTAEEEVFYDRNCQCVYRVFFRVLA